MSIQISYDVPIPYQVPPHPPQPMNAGGYAQPVHPVQAVVPQQQAQPDPQAISQARALQVQQEMAANQQVSQADRERAMAGYQSQAMAQQGAQQAGLAQQGYMHQLGMGEVQNQYQQQRDQTLIQNQQARDRFGAQTEKDQSQQRFEQQIALENNRLTQAEVIQYQRLQNQLAGVEEGVQNGTYSRFEGNEMRAQLKTHLDPLQRRMVQSQIMNEQMRTQALQQQTVQQATEFNRRQAILSQTAQERLHTVFDPHTGTYGLQQIMPDGSMAPVNFGQQAQAHMAHMYESAMNLSMQGQRFEQNAQMNPLTLQAAQENLRYLSQLHPLEIQHLRDELARGPERFGTDKPNSAAPTAMMQFDLRRGQEMLPGEVQGQGLRNTGLGLQNTGADLQNTIHRQQIEDHPMMRDLRNQALQGTISQNEVQIAHGLLQNQLLVRDVQNGVTPQVRTRTTDHVTRALRDEIAGAGRFHNVPAANRFQHTPAPANETAEQKTQREQREFGAEVTRRTNEILGTEAPHGVDQHSWDTMEGINRQSVNNRIRSGVLRVPEGANREQFVNDEIEKATAAHLGLPAAQSFDARMAVAGQAMPLNQTQQAVVRNIQGMYQSATNLPERGDNGRTRPQAFELLNRITELAGRYGQTTAMPPRVRAEYHDLLTRLSNMGVTGAPTEAQPPAAPLPANQAPRPPLGRPGDRDLGPQGVFG